MKKRAAIVLSIMTLTAYGTRVYQDQLRSFKISYPKITTAKTQFKTFYHLTNDWSQYDVGRKQQGQHLMVAFPLKNIKGKMGFYFYAVLRVGVSANKKDYAHCYDGATQYVSTKKSLGFHVLPLQSSGMMQVMTGVSYRVRYKDRCYAIEAITTGLNGQRFKMQSAKIQPVFAKMLSSFSWVVRE